eukprot:gene5677-7065_t
MEHNQSNEFGIVTNRSRGNSFSSQNGSNGRLGNLLHTPSPLQFEKDDDSTGSTNSSDDENNNKISSPTNSDTEEEKELKNKSSFQTPPRKNSIPNSASSTTTTPPLQTPSTSNTLQIPTIITPPDSPSDRHPHPNEHTDNTESENKPGTILYLGSGDHSLMTDSTSNGKMIKSDTFYDIAGEEDLEKSSELPAIEMRELSIDEQKIAKEKEEAKRLNHRRLSLPWTTHIYEISKDYGLSLIVALIGCILCILAAWAFSAPSWIKRNNGTVNYFYTESVTILTSVFFISGLALFTLVQFISVFGIKRMVQTKFYLWVVGVIGLFLVIPWGMQAGREPFWFWIGDVILLLIGYTGLCFVMGYVGKQYQTDSQRRMNGLAFLGTELLVSATALAYGMFMIQLYSGFSEINKVVWRLIIHPIYFEILMMIPVRMLVTRQMEKKGVSIMHSLAVVHAQAHISTLGRMMISTINDVEFTVVSVLLLNIGKLVFRSSVQIRDKAAGKVLNRVFHTDHKESKKFVRAVGLYTEMIMENTSIPASAFTMWAFYNVRGLFFFPYPSGGSFTLSDATINAVIQLGIAFVFDILTLYINEKYFKLPLERAWKKMKENWLPFFGFLLYGLTTMGMIGVIWMACKLPRFMTCNTLDVCSCKFVENCEQFIATKLS